MGRTVRLALIVLIFMGGTLSAAKTTGTGVVFRLRGIALLQRGDDESQLAEGNPVGVGDTVKTGAGARLEIVFNDGSDIVLGELAALLIEAFEPVTDKRGLARLAVERGAFRADVTKLEGPPFTVRTPVATIGVRGTQFWGGPMGVRRLGVMLLSGVITVENAGGQRILDRPGTGTFIDTPQTAPEPPREWSPATRAQALEQVANLIPVPLDLPPERVRNFRALMRDVVITLADHARGRDPRFLVLVRGGLALIERRQEEVALEEIHAGMPEDRLPAGTVLQHYLQTLNGLVLDDFHCAATIPRPEPSPSLRAAVRAQGVHLMTIEHCPDARQRAANAGTVSFIESDPLHQAQGVAAPWGENADAVESLSRVRTMSVLGDLHGLLSRAEWIKRVGDTNDDLLIVTPILQDRQFLSRQDIESLRLKKVGTRRLVLARLNVGQAFGDDGPPPQEGMNWLEAPRADGSRPARYWHPVWRQWIGARFAALMDLGFDGVMLEGVEAFTFFETPASRP
ncbi:MAG: extracellular endo alpha-1 4 polygalactosaminidase or related polysaccharide hydrolase-like [Rhodospirillaceae bacterium]|nr:MAG: extracellular endo alpha-1 4 polygalactosaminidase or related polysaccharide hydrolase-like [Rhodospirillaceae bacterium]